MKTILLFLCFLTVSNAGYCLSSTTVANQSLASIDDTIKSRRFGRGELNDTIYFANGKNAVISLAKIAKRKVYYYRETKLGAIIQIKPKRAVHKIVEGDGTETVINPKLSKKENQQRITKVVFIHLGIALLAVAISFGLLLLLYIIVEPW